MRFYLYASQFDNSERGEDRMLNDFIEKGVENPVHDTKISQVRGTMML